MTVTTATRPRRERPKPVKLSESAAARIHEIMASADGAYQGVRVGIRSRGCSGLSYTLEYVDQANPGDEGVQAEDVKIFIDPKAIMFLLGTEMDFVRDKLAARFVFNNPNQTAACGCGESVSITPASE
jgi:iron-sulfur cluster assembly protein